MKRLVFLFLLLFCASAQAQSSVRVNAQAVATCGGQSLTAGVFYPVTIDLTGTLCIASGAGGITAAVTVANGADAAEGNTADAAATAGGVGTLSAKQRLMTTQLATINTTLGAPLQAGGTVVATQGTSPWVVSGSIAVTQTTSPWVVSGAVTATLSAETTKVIGTVNQGTSPWVISGSLTANQSVNVAQVNGVTTLAGTGAVGTGSQRVAVGTDTATIAGSAPGTAGTASANVITTQTPAVDPCQTIVATYTPISITSATTTRIVAPTSAKKTYVCYMYIISAIANNIAIVEGTGGTCGASTAGVVGGTTAANGSNFAANSGAAFNAGGGAAFATAGTNVDLCLITSAAGPVAGTVKWVQAP